MHMIFFINENAINIGCKRAEQMAAEVNQAVKAGFANLLSTRLFLVV
jgi:hypothetical protein